MLGRDGAGREIAAGRVVVAVATAVLLHCARRRVRGRLPARHDGPQHGPDDHQHPEDGQRRTMVKATPIAPNRCAWPTSTGRRASDPSVMTSA